MHRCPLALVAGSLALLALAGCSTPDSRIERMAAAFAAYAPADQARIRAGEIAVGFTPEMVEMALGRPDRIYHRQSAEGEFDVWIYRRRTPRIGIGIGVGGGGRHTAGGVAVYSENDDDEAPGRRVVFGAGRVVSVEQRSR